MITPGHIQLMAQYNRWQNGSIYTAADTLTEAQRQESRGAFWGSIHLTLTHILWADQNWMGRFTGKTPPWFPDASQPWPKSPKESVGYRLSWDELKRQRVAFDEVISDWASTVEPSWLEGRLSYVHASGRHFDEPFWKLVTHMFNHQTHHRGQVHCMLTQYGAKPEDTDIPWMPDTA